MRDNKTELGLFYFAYVNPAEVANPNVHNRMDEICNRIQIKFKEGEYWECTATIYNDGKGLMRASRKRRILIGTQFGGAYHLEFDGWITGWPSGLIGDWIDVQFLAKPPNALALEYAATAGYEPDPWRLFSSTEAPPRPSERLATTASRVHFSRFGRVPKVVSLIYGDGTLDLESNVIEGSITATPAASPITAVDVQLSAEYEQTILNKAQAGAYEGAAGPETGDGPHLGDDTGVFSTLAVTSFDDLPRRGDKVGDWVIDDISLERVAPPTGQSGQTGVMQFDSAKNPTLEATNESGPRPIVLDKAYFRARMTLLGIQTCKRREVINFRVQWAGQSFSGYDGVVEDLPLQVGNLRFDNTASFEAGVRYNNGQYVLEGGFLWKRTETGVSGASIWDELDKWEAQFLDNSALAAPASPIFFGQPNNIYSTTYGGGSMVLGRTPTPGQSALAYAYGQAVAKIAASVRYSVSFRTPYELVRDIDGRELVHIVADQLPGGEMWGKVTGLDVDLSAASAIATVTIAAVPGDGFGHPVPVMQAYLAQAAPYAGVVRAEVLLDGQDQEQGLQARQYPAKDASGEYYDVDALLDENRTKLNVVMSPLSGGNTRQTILNFGTFFWSGPRNVDLYAE